MFLTKHVKKATFLSALKSTSRPYLYREKNRRTDVRLETILCTNKIISSVIKNNTRCSAIIVNNSEHFLFDNLKGNIHYLCIQYHVLNILSIT